MAADGVLPDNASIFLEIPLTNQSLPGYGDPENEASKMVS
jgi:hypothetical protein